MQGRDSIGIRPSMAKFESTERAVEICSFARAMPCFLNRPMIMGLLSLGIPETPFVEKFNDHVATLNQLVFGHQPALEVWSHDQELAQYRVNCICVLKWHRARAIFHMHS
jgi:hypothetical protein